MSAETIVKQMAERLAPADIERALCGIRRFGGWGPTVWRHSLAVAAHYVFGKSPSVYMFKLALLHDAGECLFGDWSSWVFRRNFLDGAVRREKTKLELAFISRIIGLPVGEHHFRQIKEIDEIVGGFEYFYLLPERIRDVFKDVVEAPNPPKSYVKHLFGVYIYPEAPPLEDLLNVQTVREARDLLEPLYFYQTIEDGVLV